MVPLTLEQARRAFGHRVILWGGIPSVILSPSWPEESFRAYVRRVLEVVAPGEAFILGVADNVMPDSLIERVAWIVELLEAEGACPLPRAAGATPVAG
jgi:uroporphyrinogen-III decarboxylase